MKMIAIRLVCDLSRRTPSSGELKPPLATHRCDGVVQVTDVLLWDGEDHGAVKSKHEKLWDSSWGELLTTGTSGDDHGGVDVSLRCQVAVEVHLRQLVRGVDVPA